MGEDLDSPVTIGAPAAERDKLLKDCFVESSVYRATVNHDCTILLGNRGAGKSAIFVGLKAQLERNGEAVIEIKPEDYSYEMVSSSISGGGLDSWAQQSNYTAAWKYVILTLAMRAVRNGARDVKSGSYRKIHKYLAAKYKSDRIDVIDELLSYIGRFKGLSVGGASASFSENSVGSLYKIEELIELQPALEELLEETPVTVLIDELDRGWDASDSARYFVAGIFQASIWLNSIPNLNVIVSLRRELCDNIPEIFDDAQKFRDVLRYVEWSEDSLKEIAARRLKEVFSLPPDATVDGAWSSVFVPVLSFRGTDSFSYIVDRTLYRPREIILFVNDCLEQSAKRLELIDYSLISEAEKKYSKDRLQDIAAEYRFQYPGILSVMDAFRGRVYRISRSELISLIDQIRSFPSSAKMSWLSSLDNEGVIKALYDVGFIKALAVGGDKGKARSGSKWVGQYQNSLIDLGRIDSFQVHPMFRSALNMKEK